MVCLTSHCSDIPVTPLAATNSWSADLSQWAFSMRTLKLNPGDSNQSGITLLKGENELEAISDGHFLSWTGIEQIKAIFRVRGEREVILWFSCSFSTIGSMPFYGLSWNAVLCFPEKHLYLYTVYFSGYLSCQSVSMKTWVHRNCTSSPESCLRDCNNFPDSVPLLLVAHQEFASETVICLCTSLGCANLI